MNLINLTSTMLWQGRMHWRLAQIGYDEVIVRRLIATNWVRAAALLVQSFVALSSLVKLTA